MTQATVLLQKGHYFMRSLYLKAGNDIQSYQYNKLSFTGTYFSATMSETSFSAFSHVDTIFWTACSSASLG